MSTTLVIFGASGDLTRRKLIPALYRLDQKGRLPADTRIVGFSRTEFTHEAWRAKLAESTAKIVGSNFSRASWEKYASRIFYQPGDISVGKDFVALNNFLREVERGPATRIYYLATAPHFYETAVEQLGAAGMAGENGGERRIVIEKPFGCDLNSARALNAAVHRVFGEDQVYRIDHYLGKETVQNMLVLRFANTIFEPIWNRRYIDHVQVTVAEEVDIGNRADYYEEAGILRDMFQNHLLQLVTFTAMEPPSRYDATTIRDEKVKVLRAIRPTGGDDIRENSLRGQYDGYRKAPHVATNSQTATFAAVRLWIDNWRWQGVPFYLRSGKAMSCRTTQIVIQFREPPHMIFTDGPRTPIESDRLLIQVQPAEGIEIHFQTKVPDSDMALRQSELDFSYQREFRGTLPEAYERLLLDAMEGDASLFARSDEVEAAWALIDPIQKAWTSGQPPLYLYEPGYWGPTESTEWMTRQGRQWFDACPILE